jgi:hypothetical protein
VNDARELNAVGVEEPLGLKALGCRWPRQHFVGRPPQHPDRTVDAVGSEMVAGVRGVPDHRVRPMTAGDPGDLVGNQFCRKVLIIDDRGRY